MSNFKLSIVPRSPRIKSPVQDSQGLACSSSPGFFHASSLPLASACSLCQDPDRSHFSVVAPQVEVSWTLLPGLSHLFLLSAFAYINLFNGLANTACQCHKDRDHKPLALDTQPVIQVNVAAGKGKPRELSVRISFCQIWESSAFVSAYRHT